MAITDTKELPTDSKYLIELFKKDVKERLVQAGIDAVRPEIERAANAAIASMKLGIEKHYEGLQDRTIVAIVVDGVRQ